ncbi:hypothetical protein PoMZ_13537 [Pyricularia oryzae]|uniref:AVR-Pik-like HMA interaction domain-containing protein n=1 Tax=Pyricularia oryzae TaxID=318829 RepID=A0A4P7NVB7_PYROR|nr:hypothetical protein PoMZ_13537 [Pyricularia oryzae]
MRFTTFNAFFLSLGTIATVNARKDNEIMRKGGIDLSREPDPNFIDHAGTPPAECFWFMYYNGQRIDAGTCYSAWSFGLKVGSSFVDIKTDEDCNLYGTYAPGWIVLGKKRPGF